MAIYHGSIRRPVALRRADAPLGRLTTPRVIPAATQSPPETQAAVAPPSVPAPKPAKATKRAKPPVVPTADLASQPLENLLQLPREELAKLLAESGESASKVWLALIYRLSALESQVTELASALRIASVSTAKAPLSTARAGAGDGKSEVLEQVFRKNLSLRKRGGE